MIEKEVVTMVMRLPTLTDRDGNVLTQLPLKGMWHGSERLPAGTTAEGTGVRTGIPGNPSLHDVRGDGHQDSPVPPPQPGRQTLHHQLNGEQGDEG